MIHAATTELQPTAPTSAPAPAPAARTPRHSTRTPRRAPLRALTLLGLGATALVGAVAPSAALASGTLDVTRSGSELRISGTTSGDTQIQIDADSAVFIGGSEVTLKSSTPKTCIDRGDYLECGEPDITDLRVNITGTGNDSVEISEAPFMPGTIVEVGTGEGDDELLSYGPQRIFADLGAGNDSASTDEGLDQIHGGAGNDVILPGDGFDVVWGDDGNDRFIADVTADSNDWFDGGADTAGGATRAAGDVIDYSARRTPVAVTLPPDTTTLPSLETGGWPGANGAAGERDTLAHVESVVGADEAASTLTGNERANLLRGGEANDALRGNGGNDWLVGALGDDRYEGGDGSDLIDARTGTGSPSSGGDADSSIDCGSGDDGVRRDLADGEGIGCEHQAPLLLEAPSLSGALNVGSSLSVNRGATIGEVGPVSTAWFVCPAGTQLRPGQTPDSPSLGCRVGSIAPTFKPLDRDLGMQVIGQITLLWSFGAGDVGFTAVSDPLGPGSGGGSGPTPGPSIVIQRPDSTQGQLRPGETFAQYAKRLAEAQLGAGALASNITLGKGTAVFEAPIAAKGVLKVKGNAKPRFANVICELACIVTADTSVSFKTGKGKKAKTKTLKMKTQAVKSSPTKPADIRFLASAKQRKLIRKAKKPKLTVNYTLEYEGTTRRATKRYLIALK